MGVEPRDAMRSLKGCLEVRSGRGGGGVVPLLLVAFVLAGWCGVAASSTHLKEVEASLDASSLDASSLTPSLHELNACNVFAAGQEPPDPNNMPVVGNGYAATLLASNATFINGVYSGLKGSTPSHRARIPSTLLVNLTNIPLTAVALDVERATYTRRYENGEHVSARQVIYAHRVHRSLMVMELHTSNDGGSPSTLQLSWAYPYSAAGNRSSNGPSLDIHFEEVPTGNPSLVATAGPIVQTETPSSSQVQVGVCTTSVPSSISLAPGERRSMFFLTTFSTSLEEEDPAASAIALHDRFSRSSPTALRLSHVAAWRRLWRSGIEVRGNVTVAQSVNSSLYEIISSVRDDWPFGISPGGIATNAYNGHVFWDMETWIYPSFMLLHPILAHQFLDYRLERIPAAQQKASLHALNGTMFPWESAFTGVECTPWDGGKNTEGELELHIVADIAIAAFQFYRATGDRTWLINNGSKLLFGAAEFWSSRVELNSTSGLYSILSVQPPDESAGCVNNSVYTNAAVATALFMAAETKSILNDTHNPEWASLDEERWIEIASNMYIPFDEATMLHPEYDGYNGENINQADVALLQYPLQYPMSKTVATNDLSYYEEKTRKNGYFTGTLVEWPCMSHYCF
eukprot:TRINITY_DN1202_c0_g1_i3.p1 TRINITY_DN1202_c0_g1~~TRINITY_DN1202_c0_g1_i3.p1  ORF type:complete len:630 (+),score=83.51 TRINITY_DN1202_c0_g1_i3:230-2119(+)